MNKTLKVLLVVAGSGFALVALAVAGAAYWFSQNKADIRAASERASADGSAFGLGKSAKDCETEGLRRVDQCNGILCAAGNEIFAKACLGAASVPADYCAKVPKPELDALLDTATYRNESCQKAGRSGTYCHEFFGAIQDFCHPSTTQ